MRYPHIAKAAVMLACDNGKINRVRSKESFLRDVSHIFAAFTAGKLDAIDAWLGTLSEHEVETLVAGEETEMNEVVARGPRGVDELFNMIFEEA